MLVHEKKFILQNVKNQFVCNDHFVAFSTDNGNVLVYNVNSSYSKNIVLNAGSEITALCFNDDVDRGYMCSAGENITLWKLSAIKLSFLTKESVDGSVLSLSKGKISSLALSKDGAYVGACSADNVKVYCTKNKTLLTTVKQFGNLNNMAFSPHMDPLIITTMNNNILNVMDIGTGSLLYQTECEGDIISIDTCENNFTLGSSLGIVVICEYPIEGQSKICHKYNMIEYRNKGGYNKLHGSDQSPVLCLKYLNEDIIIVCLHDIILQMEVMHSHAVAIFQITDHLEAFDGSIHMLSFLVEIKISKSFFQDKATFVMETQNKELHIVSFWMGNTKVEKLGPESVVDAVKHESRCNEIYDQNYISVISREPLHFNSFLKSELKFKSKPSKKISDARLDKRGKILSSQPIIFHKNIRSSGYLEKKNQSVSKKEAGLLTEELKFSSNREFVAKYLDIHEDIDMSSKSLIRVSENFSPINQMSFSGNGQFLLCSSTDGIISLLKKYKDNFTVEKAFHAHNHMINHVDFSHSSNLFISCGDDNKAIVFDSKKCIPIITLNQKSGNVSKSRMQINNFTAQVEHGQFYYMDKFIILAHENELLLYNYFMDETQTDLKRIKSNNKYKLVQSISMQSKKITSFSAINSFYSYIGLCCCSDKNLYVVDFNTSSVIKNFIGIHEKTAHVVEQYKGTGDASISPSLHDTFLTSAIGDGIKLWDLRSPRYANKFDQHKNRVHPCGVAFSPSGKYITTGSEDGEVHIYDSRKGLINLAPRRVADCLLSATFNPATAEATYGTLCGKIAVYGQ